MFETRNRIASIRTDGSDLQTTGLGLHHQTICQTLRSTTEDMGRRVSCARAGRLGAMAYGLCSCIVLLHRELLRTYSSTRVASTTTTMVSMEALIMRLKEVPPSGSGR